MSKTFYLKFGTGDPVPFSGLSPTFTLFSAAGLTAIAAPGITETPTGSGYYRFDYPGPTLSVIFKADGGSNLASGDRYISGVLDPIQAVDQQVGYVTDSFGSSSVDPATILGYLKRTLEFLEGDSIFTKATAIWQIFNRTSNGTTTLLRTKSLSNTTTSATKTGV